MVFTHLGCALAGCPDQRKEADFPPLFSRLVGVCGGGGAIRANGRYWTRTSDLSGVSGML